ncbi:glycosyltransferase family 2 protein [Carboxylicivirga marina]|uniref:glycosyltransferase family 2 protein n=1 Tax=Carboxylicivirga marina TaxID=2800988 RepID=UPI002596F842|nr:glycosyltransferase family 2 protein [uncultured Carboxylicivirga sp.]
MVKVSIVTVVYNGEKYIERTIRSVLSQTYNNIEYIIIDGGSEDGTIEIIKKYESKISCWYSEPDKGISDAFNKGIRKASGEIIGLLNADDWFEENAVDAILGVLSDEKYDFALGYLKKYTDSGTYISYPENLYSKSFRYRALIFNHPSCFFRKTMYNSHGLYDINLRFAMDYDYILRAINGGSRYGVVKDVIVNMQDGGMSETHIINTMKEVTQISINHGANPFLCSLLLSYKLLITRLRMLLNLPKVGTLIRNRRLRSNEV